ncbi:MAG: carbon monoxide dehydrogenase subunit G [Deltaproteobacteria bacterium]|nr:carbon monoxide dehydrogenase subunit G [Deltaproteobacteria bacterium]
MKLAGDHRFERAGVQDVWDALFDPEVLAAAMPGCEKLELVDGKLVGEMVIKVGPVSGKFSGTVAFADVVAPASYRMVIDGKGGPGFVNATAALTLTADGDGTRLTYDADAKIGGKLASVGERLVLASSRAIAKQSLDNLGTNIAIRIANRTGATPAAAPASTEPTTETPAPPTAPAAPSEAAIVAAATTPTTEPAAPAEAASASTTDTVTPAEAAIVAAATTPTEPAAPAEAASASAAAKTDAAGARSTDAAAKGDVEVAKAPATTPAASAEVAVTAPKQAYVKADAKALAATATKAALGAMWPYLVVAAAAIALVVWLLVR